MPCLRSPELERMAEELATIPDRFNDIFAERGWIIYDMMNVEIAKSGKLMVQVKEVVVT